MDSKILSYADEILSTDTMTESEIREFLREEYGLHISEIDAVIAVLEGEGYFDVA